MALKYKTIRTNTDYIVIHHFGITVNYFGNVKIEQKACENSFSKHPEYFYHYVILSDGTIFKGNDEAIVVYHANNHKINDTSIAVCVFGNFMKQNPTKQQIEQLTKLILTLSKKYSIKPQNIVGHRDVGDARTDCPGDNLYNLIPNIRKEVANMVDKKQELLNWAVQKGLIQNPEVHKNLDEPFTKAQILAILKNLIERLKIDVGG